VLLSGKTVGKALASAGVIASLVFVGLELRQSNAQAQAAAYQAIGSATAAVFDSWAHDPDLTAISLKDPAELDPVEWQQLAWKFSAFARLGEMVLLQIDREILDEGAIDRLGYGGWRIFLDQPAACVWPLIREGVSEEFRALVEDGRDPGRLDCSKYALPPPR